MLALFLIAAATAATPAPVHFSRDVLPILSDRCFHCHGPDESHRKAKLRLDLQAEAIKEAIVPGKPEESEVMHRILSTDADELMPPPDSHRKPLTAKESEILRNWIAQGAPWGKHWAFEKPVKEAVPAGVNSVDHFVREKLAEEELVFSGPAPKHTQIRRLSLDLTGLPPTAEEARAFLQDESPQAWDAAVERVLNSPHLGERLAMWWLDAARYADTDGFQGDAERTSWPWRDWVVKSFNDNKPFDQFTIEQFAGDLLPNATAEQKLATAFHRHHMTNGEGGRDPEESRIDYVIDRVNTTGTVFLGLTLGCVQCHSHKFDPIAQKDYYQLFAYFNSIDEDGKAGNAAKPYLKYTSPYAQRSVVEMQKFAESLKPVETAAREEAKTRFAPWLEKTKAEVPKNFRAWEILEPSAVTATEGTTFTREPGGIVQATGPNPVQDDYRVVAPGPATRITGFKLEVLPHASHTQGKLSRGKNGEFILTDIKFQVRSREGDTQVRDLAVTGAVADVEKEAKTRQYGLIKDTLDDDPRNGWTTEGHDPLQPHTGVYELAEPLLLEKDEELVVVMLHRSTEGDANIGRFRLSVTGQRGETVRSLKTAPLEELAAGKPAEGELRNRLFEQFLIDDAVYQDARKELDEANRQLAELKKASGELQVMVCAEKPEPRESNILVRGVWDAKGDKVQPGVLPAILSWPAEKARTRLDFAKWIVSPENPLTARVVVNHLWQMVYGAGLVRTPEDFGLQGERPTHPELLDYLAVELVENGWDLRHILRILVSNETYRQSSSVTPSLLEKDPENRLLARAPRFRLQSWMIRDAALQTSGLLNPAIGGPPVKPYQPEGVWEELFMGRYTYVPSAGPAQYRRTLYAYWRRSIAPVFLFDSAQRRVCEVGVRRTNTPLQALTLLNDATMLEASRKLAEIPRIPEIGFHVLSRDLTADELAVVTREADRALAYYQAHPAEAREFLKVGQAREVPFADAPALASRMVAASLLLNLDEAITRE